MTHNSIRIRIRKSELARLAQDHRIAESIAFGPSMHFHFSLSILPTGSTLSADLGQQEIRVSLPFSLAQPWMNSAEVSLEAHHPLENGASLHILVEKDFPCLDRVDENKADTFWELAPETSEAC